MTNTEIVFHILDLTIVALVAYFQYHREKSK